MTGRVRLFKARFSAEFVYARLQNALCQLVIIHPAGKLGPPLHLRKYPYAVFLPRIRNKIHVVMDNAMPSPAIGKFTGESPCNRLTVINVQVHGST